MYLALSYDHRIIDGKESVSFLKMIKEIIFFYKNAPLIPDNEIKDKTLGNFLERSNSSKYFVEYHIIPMVAAIWSVPLHKAREMPLALYLTFFIDLGLFLFRLKLIQFMIL